MSAPTPSGDPTPSGQTTPEPPSGRPGSGRKKVTELDRETFRKYARRTGWLLLVLIISYIGLQLPLPFRLLSVAAGLAGVVGGALLLISCFRRRLPVLMHISAVAAVLCCGMFAFTGGAQALFWEATAEFDQCRAQALTERSMNQCYVDYEQNMLGSVPGLN